MRSSRGSIWWDKRLWVAAALALVIKAGVPRLFEEAGTPPVALDPALAPTRPQPPATGPMADLERVMREQQIRRINLHDGSSAEPPMTPEAAAAWIGGLVMFLGGFGAVWLWRRAEHEGADVDGDEQFPTS